MASEREFESAKYCNMAVIAWKREDKARPDRTMVTVLKWFLMDRTMMKRMERMPKRKAKRVVERKKEEEKTRIDRFAPKTDALETPSVCGLAMSLSRLVCMTRPAMERPPPTKRAPSILGRRI